MLELNQSSTPFFRLFLCILSIGFSGMCHTASAQDGSKLPADIAANVNGRNIPFAMITQVEQQLTNSENSPNREDILLELIDLELLTQRAETQKLDEKPEIAAQLQLLYSQTMANAYLQSLSAELQVSDEQVRAEYDKQLEQLERTEYRASHILLESEADALEIIAALNDNNDFAELAKERSTGPSAKQGGDLGWFDDGTMVAEFTAAVSTLSKGEITQAPVQTQFGWHVIKLVDTRSGQVPDFESVKAGIKNLMVRNLLEERVTALRELANITRIE